MIVVLGLGRETRELLHVLETEHPGAEVSVLDEHDPVEPPVHPRLRLSVRGGVDLDDSHALPGDTTELYRSPGVSPYRPAVAALVRRGVPVTTPTGWWASRRDGGDVIAITGTKGKSTTAAMTAHLLRAAGREVDLVGNIGTSALHRGDASGAGPDDVVLELSSYQLADLRGRFGLAGITTLHRDHVPWHGSVERYHHDKLRLLALSETTIVTPQVAAHERLTATAVGGVTTALHRPAAGAALRAAGLAGEHVVDDALLAAALVDARLGRPEGWRELVERLADFRGLPHRLAPVGSHGGVRWVDDSISTVPESAVAAAHAYRDRGPVTLLLGGDDRGQDLAPIVELLADERIRALLLPPLAERLQAALEPVAGGRVQACADLREAVETAARLTPRGGTVVLSPAAPSFSAYRDFVARGEHFARLVAELGPSD